MITNNGEGRIVPVSRRDCAEAAAIVLTTDGHVGETYEITGAEALSATDLAELFLELSGRRVKVVQLSDAMLAEVLAGIGTPLPNVVSLTAFGRAVRLGYFNLIDGTFERLSGHPPMSLREVLIAHRADLLAVA
jgi:NAD(P)H dehydrogenase (quinone)